MIILYYIFEAFNTLPCLAFHKWKVWLWPKRCFAARETPKRQSYFSPPGKARSPQTHVYPAGKFSKGIFPSMSTNELTGEYHENAAGEGWQEGNQKLWNKNFDFMAPGKRRGKKRYNCHLKPDYCSSLSDFLILQHEMHSICISRIAKEISLFSKYY